MNLPLYPAKAVCILLIPVAAALAALWICLERIDSADAAARELSLASTESAGQAQALERGATLCAYNLRGYVASGEKAYLDRAKKELSQAMLALHELRGENAGGGPKDGAPGRALSAGPVASADSAGRAQSPGKEAREGFSPILGRSAPKAPDEPSALERTGFLFDEYKKRAELAVSLYESLEASRAGFVEAADAYAAAALEAEKAAQDAIDAGLGVKYPLVERVRTRLSQARSARQARAAGEAVRSAYAGARIDRRPATLREALPEFAKAADALAAMTSASDPGDELVAPKVAMVRAALVEYEARARALLDEWLSLESAGGKLLVDERAVLEAAAGLARERATVGSEAAQALSKSLTWSRRFALAAAWGMGIFGLAWAVIGAVLLAGPVVRCASFAKALVKGDLRPTLTVTGHDEAGALADALRELARRMGRSLAR